MNRIPRSQLRSGVAYRVVANAGYFSKTLTLLSIQDGLYNFSDVHIVTSFMIDDSHVQVYPVL